MTEEIDRPSLSGTSLLPADASVYRKLFDISSGWWSSLFMRLREISIAFPASGGTTLALWFRFVAFYMSYPDMIRQKILLIKRLLKGHVLASDASRPDLLRAFAPGVNRSMWWRMGLARGAVSVDPVDGIHCHHFVGVTVNHA